MYGAHLSIKSERHPVDLIYRNPKMICASRATIKWHVEKALNQTRKAMALPVSFTVMATTIPLLITSQQFEPVFGLSPDVIRGAVGMLAALSTVTFIGSGFYTWRRYKMMSSEYVVDQIVSDEDSTGEENTSSILRPLSDYPQ